MGAKAIYTDTRRHIIHELIISKDIKMIKGILHDRDEYKKYASSWQAVNLMSMLQNSTSLARLTI